MSGWNARISLRNLRHSRSTTHGDVREATMKDWQVTPASSRDAICLVTWIIEAFELGIGVTARTRRGRSASLSSIVPTLTGRVSNVQAIAPGSIAYKLADRCSNDCVSTRSRYDQQIRKANDRNTPAG